MTSIWQQDDVTLMHFSSFESSEARFRYVIVCRKCLIFVWHIKLICYAEKKTVAKIFILEPESIVYARYKNKCFAVILFSQALSKKKANDVTTHEYIIAWPVEHSFSMKFFQLNFSITVGWSNYSRVPLNCHKVAKFYRRVMLFFFRVC